MTDEERTFPLECERAFHLHPRALERKILEVHGRHIPHNRLWAVLREVGLVTDTPSLQRWRKPWVRFERRFANSLWQMDFTL